MIIQTLAAFVTTIFFSIIFNVNRRELIYCGFVGSFGWLIYLLAVDSGKNTILSSFFAALIISILSHILAIYRKNPVTVYQIAGIIPIVPGALLYSAVFKLINDNITGSIAAFVEAMQIAGSIAVAMLSVASISKFTIKLTHLQQK